MDRFLRRALTGTSCAVTMTGSLEVCIFIELGVMSGQSWQPFRGNRFYRSLPI
ncbi:hypothetical protein DF3PB_2180006 [uncultured Defluviicoccus sp.]|uniref:Uncharacterized protein n=1 Tax=metagenome TaxID=256318 RepID=A0A380TE25_9ZZZZ|nr:hypothetical protein DF3PB_2180006 [uncultured Defluviicoccus sp.]